MVLIFLLILSPFCGFLIHAIDIVVEHFLLFFAQIGYDTLFPEKFIAQLLTQSKCMHIARECTAKKVNSSISNYVQRAVNTALTPIDQSKYFAGIIDRLESTQGYFERQQLNAVALNSHQN